MVTANRFTVFLRRYDTAIWIRVLGNALNAMTTFIIRPFLALYLFDKLEGSILYTMMVIGLQPFASMITGVFAGSLSDRFGRKPVMIAALLIQVFSLGAYSMANSVWLFAIITAVLGVGTALFTPAANAMVSDVVHSDRQAEVFALLHTASNVGAAFGPVIGILLFQWNSNIVFLAGSVMLLAYLTLVLWKVPESLAQVQSHAGTIPDNPTYHRWFAHKALYGLTLLAMPLGLIYALVISILPFHLGDHFARPEDLLASLMTFNGVFVIALQLWLIKRTEHFAAYRIIGLSYAMYAAVSFGYGFSHYVALLFFFEFIFSIGEMLVGPHLQKAVSQLAPPDKRGFYFSIFGLHLQLPLAFGPVIGGLLYTAYDGKVLFSLVGILFLLSGAAQVMLIRWLKRRNEALQESNRRLIGKGSGESVSIH
ncbi:MFS transporter [Paenibacillus sp. sptzw28]|uniref:MDR family MFS transporter n=1 Tax=Paenibacillus sp. sptzw28 TaxID=715179 RepID=UPI001C6EECB2|nr:MFS transporter [Paenibacillus sp. sptzw28]QYR23491.1 MFS transporter [Paenibacillus sp. sptzw28]